uniref:Sushi domain-containing protein n=1 Tax=Denticeps clupeoides TaxID=299321 RepID=A0AAY4ELY9_9TELE
MTHILLINLFNSFLFLSCGPPHTIKSTVPISDSHPVGTKIRYMCVKGYKRRAGTSSLIVCKINKMTNLPTWETSLPLECICKNLRINTINIQLPTVQYCMPLLNLYVIHVTSPHWPTFTSGYYCKT